MANLPLKFSALGYVYKITNLVNGRVYVGSTGRVPRIRKNCHWSDLRKGNHDNPHLQKAWDKYGEDNFRFEVVSFCARENVWQKEKDMIGSSPFPYNIAEPGPNPMVGRAFSEEHRAKMSEAAKARHKGCTDYKNLERARQVRWDRQGRKPKPVLADSPGRPPIKCTAEHSGIFVCAETMSDLSEMLGVSISALSLAKKEGRSAVKEWEVSFG